MKKEIKNHLENALCAYSSSKFLPGLIEAKNRFFEITGNLNEEDGDYESRMNSFNDWYLVNYVLTGLQRTQLKDYVLKTEMSEDLGHGFLNLEYSLFEFVGKSGSSDFICSDLLRNEKILVSDSEGFPAIFKGDVFTGRIIKTADLNYFLPGICVLPKELKKSLVSASRKVTCLKSSRDLVGFLLKLEYLKTKSIRYSHLPFENIFQFD